MNGFKLFTRILVSNGFTVSRRSLLIPCSSNVNLTLVGARAELRNIVGSPLIWGDPPQHDPSSVNAALPSKQSDLPARRMVDSYREGVIPITKDKQLWQKYVNFYRRIRFGRIMEDLDTMAVLVGYSHNRDPMKGPEQKSSIAIVTALVDSIKIKAKAIREDRDVIIRGHTTWVGTSSMEISLSVEQENNGTMESILTAKFLMVARDPGNKVKAVVNPLVVETPEEKALFEAGEGNKLIRQTEAEFSLLKVPPNSEERLVIHDLFLKTLDLKAATFKTFVKPENSKWMDEAVLKNVIICFPQERNLYSKIFGGFLMRQAFELAWTNSCLFSKTRPRLVAVDDIVFRRPVELGSLLFLSSQVVYTKSPDLQVRVHAEVVNPATGSHETTNIFHYTFTTENVEIPTIMPRSYAEYMLYLDGKRRFEKETGVQ